MGIFLEKLNKITITQIKRNISSGICLSFFILLFTNIIYGFSNLNEIESLFPLERFIPLIGLTLIMPILEPELDFGIYQVVRVRETSLVFIYLIRLMIALILYSLFIIGILFYMNKNGCTINYNTYFYETLSIGVFLGSIGFILIGITQNKVYALLGSLSYYLLNWFVNYKKLGSIYLFRLSRGLAPLNEFKCLLAFLFIIIGLISCCRRKI